MQLLTKRGRHYRRPALWKKILLWSVISLLATIIVVGLAGFIFVYHTLGKIGEDTQVIFEARQQLDVPLPDEPENILVLGADADPDSTSKRSDTIMLVRINPQGECLSILSMPRDLIVDIPGYGQDKINTAYAVGGMPLAIDTVKKLTGQPVHHFVLVDYTGFEQAVDALGGVYVDIDQRYFNDNSDAYWGQDYEPIDIWPGYQRLGGKDALAFVRYRHTDSDFMRIARQQHFISDVKAQSFKWGNLSRIPELADVFASNTTSDIGRNDILSLTKFMLEVGGDHIYQAQMPVQEKPGGPGGTYVALIKDKLTGTMEDFVNPPLQQPQSGGDTPAPAGFSDPARLVSVEIMNGNGVDGDAERAANLLKQKGLAKVENGGNARNSYSENQIYFRDGYQAAADEICSVLKPCQVSPMPPELVKNAQVLVVVGSAFGQPPESSQKAAKAQLHFDDGADAGWDDWREATIQLSFPVEKPASFPKEFSYKDFRTYDIDTDDGPKPALKVVCENETGAIWGIMETTYTEAPLLDKPTVEKEISGKNLRYYYMGDALRYVAWQEGDVVYWITNTLQNELSEDTMVKMATSFASV